MNEYKEVVSVTIYLVNIQYSCFLELLDVLTMMLAESFLFYQIYFA